MDTLLDTVWTTFRSLGVSPRCPEISASECNSEEQTLSMSETGNHRGSAARVDEPHDLQTRDPEFDSRFEVLLLRSSGSRIQRRRRNSLQKLMLIRNKLALLLKRTPTSKKLN